jgi:hypothetical protein
LIILFAIFKLQRFQGSKLLDKKVSLQGLLDTFVRKMESFPTQYSLIGRMDFSSTHEKTRSQVTKWLLISWPQASINGWISEEGRDCTATKVAEFTGQSVEDTIRSYEKCFFVFDEELQEDYAVKHRIWLIDRCCSREP